VGEPRSPPLRPDFQSGLLSPSLGGSPLTTPLSYYTTVGFRSQNPPHPDPLPRGERIERNLLYFLKSFFRPFSTSFFKISSAAFSAAFFVNFPQSRLTLGSSNVPLILNGTVTLP